MNKNSSHTQNTYSNSSIHAHERSLGELNLSITIGNTFSISLTPRTHYPRPDDTCHIRPTLHYTHPYLWGIRIRL